MLRSLIALSLAVLILSAWAWSFFIPNHYKIEQSIVLPVSKDYLFNELKTLKTQSSLWITGNKEKAELEFKGVDAEIGAELIIHTSDFSLRQKLSKIIEGERLESQLWLSQLTGANLCYLQFESIGKDSTILTWGLMGNQSFPSDLLMKFGDASKVLENKMSEGLQQYSESLDS